MDKCVRNCERAINSFRNVAFYGTFALFRLDLHVCIHFHLFINTYISMYKEIHSQSAAAIKFIMFTF